MAESILRIVWIRKKLKEYVKITLDKYVHVTMQMKRDNMAKVKLAV